jgi:hypothetical protein
MARLPPLDDEPHHQPTRETAAQLLQLSAYVATRPFPAACVGKRLVIRVLPATAAKVGCHVEFPDGLWSITRGRGWARVAPLLRAQAHVEAQW